jgi:pyruvate dehydrogenase E2 component (dihydrolipoamide acetyltransferase)
LNTGTFQQTSYAATPSHYQCDGSIAGRYAIPIVLPPTVAIVGAGKAREQATVVDGKVVIRNILPLSITVDHRVVTGGEATRFIKTFILDIQKQN